MPSTWPHLLLFRFPSGGHGAEDHRVGHGDHANGEGPQGFPPARGDFTGEGGRLMRSITVFVSETFLDPPARFIRS